MTRDELALTLCGEYDVSGSTAKQMVKYLFGVIEEALKGGEEVDIARFGKFSIRETPPRTGRNPRTGEQVQIKAGSKPVFKYSLTVKKALKG